MCARCESKAVHVKTNSWRLLAAQGLTVNAISALMMRFARKGGKISVNTARSLVNDYIKWLNGQERPV